ncbi:MAG: hypothetical protein AAF550_12190, partial [Myxococcota bacterium]
STGSSTVEYQLDMVNQIQVHDSIGLSFARTLLDARVQQGLSAEYRLQIEGVEEIVHRSHELRTWFPNQHRVLSRYVQNWPFDRWDIPSSPPPIDVTLRGTLTVPSGPDRALRLRHGGRADLLVDDAVYRNEAVLAPGDHSVEVRWRSSSGADTALEFCWAIEGGPCARIPNDAFRPSEASSQALRLVVWLTGALLALFFGAGVFFVVLAPSRMLRCRRLGATSAVAICLLGLALRLFDYQVMPEFQENDDELFATWNGYELLRSGETVGWSMWASAYGPYADVELLPYFRPKPLKLIRPYFEHPPLMHLLVGAAAIAGGAEHFTHARLQHTRLVPIALSLLSLVLIIAIGARSFPGTAAGLCAGFLWACVPTIVLQGRVIKEEALVGPLALGACYFYLRYRDEGCRARDRNAMALLLGLAPLAKLPALAFAPGFVVLLAAKRRYRDAIALGVGTLLVASLIFVYAGYFGWDSFWFATRTQAIVRPPVWDLYFRFFTMGLINHNMVGEGWTTFLWFAWLIGLASAAALTRSPDSARPSDSAPAFDVAHLYLPMIFYLLAIGYSSGTWTFGWYWMPLYPFLCLGAGRFLHDLWHAPDLVRGVLLLGFAGYGLLFLGEVSPDQAGSVGATLMPWVLSVGGLLFAFASASASTVARYAGRFALVSGMGLFLFTATHFITEYDRIFTTYPGIDRMQALDH